MKRIINLALISILTLSALGVQARTFSSDEIKAEVSKQIVESNAKYTDAQLVATVIALPFQNLTLPDGKVTFTATSCLDKFMARDLKKINVYVNGCLAKTFNAPTEVKAYKDVLVASETIEREKLLTNSIVTTKKMEVSNILESVLSSDMLEKEIITKKGFREGEVIDRRFVKLRPDVQRSAEVTAYVTINNLMVSINATALSDGMLGEYIGVENKSYKKVYTGKIIGENKVLIEM
jgi:flagella basal body P-ring formation protein FlgA